MSNASVARKYDRCCMLLRKGDWNKLMVAHPEGASTWIRKVIAEHVDALMAKRAERDQAMLGPEQPAPVKRRSDGRKVPNQQWVIPEDPNL